MAKEIEGFLITTKSKSELAAAYGISIDTLTRWIKALPAAQQTALGNIKSKKILQPAQVTVLIEFWGAP